MKKLKKQTTASAVLALLFSLTLFAFSFMGGIESSPGLLFAYRFLNITVPLFIITTLIGIIRLKPSN